MKPSRHSASSPSSTRSNSRVRPVHWALVSAIAAIAAALWAGGVQAQTALRGGGGAQVGRTAVAPAGQAPGGGAPAGRVPGSFGLPSPSGLASPSPFPAGLPPVVVPSAASPSGAAGVGALDGNGTAGVTPGVGVTNNGVNGGVGVNNGFDNGGNPIFFEGSAGNPTAVLGAGPGTPPIPQSVPLGSGPYNPVDVARSFITADANRDGELTQGEWQRVRLRAGSFEAMDRNFDGRISRSEYDDGLR